MPKRQRLVSKDVKDQILKRIREEGVPVSQAAGSMDLTPEPSTNGSSGA